AIITAYEAVLKVKAIAVSSGMARSPRSLPELRYTERGTRTRGGIIIFSGRCIFPLNNAVVSRLQIQVLHRSLLLAQNRVKGNNGHGADLSVCLLMTHSGHCRGCITSKTALRQGLGDCMFCMAVVISRPSSCAWGAYDLICACA